MSSLLRCGMIAAGIAGAFAAGFYLKSRTSEAHSSEPTLVAVTPTLKTASARTTISSPTTTRTMVVPSPAKSKLTIEIPVIRMPDLPHPAPARPGDDLPPATLLGTPTPASADPIDLTDPGLQMVKKSMGIKTTILDKSEPLPAVLVAGSNEPPQLPTAEPPTVKSPSIPDIVLPPAPLIAVPNAPAPAVKLVNKRDIALDFELTKIGSSNVTAVELWTTRDGGVIWTRTDRMEGCMPPFRTRLGSDGEYGFRLVCESEAGRRTPEPRRGDVPDQRVCLDTTSPQVANLRLEPVANVRDKICIRWTMDDAHLDPRAVRIEYSSDGHTWHRAVTDSTVRGDGEHGYSWIWTVPPGLPHQAMIRVTARDWAGNEAHAQLPEKLSIDLVVPEGKLTGIRPSGMEIGPVPRDVTAEANRQIFSLYVGLFDGR